MQIEERIIKSFGRCVVGSVDMSVEESVEENVEENVEESVEESVERGVEESVERGVAKSVAANGKVRYRSNNEVWNGTQLEVKMKGLIFHFPGVQTVSKFIGSALGRLASVAKSERGDVPGWVLVVLMTTGLVTGIWTLAAPEIEQILRTSLSSMNGIR